MPGETIALSTRFLFNSEGRVKAPTMIYKGFTVPGTDVKVQMYDLSYKLLDVAFFNLMRLGYIKLEIVATKYLFFFKEHRLMVSKLKEFPSRQSLEGQLMKHITAEQKQVVAVIFDFFGADYDSPEKEVIHRALTDATDNGLGAFEDNKNTGKTDAIYHPSAERVSLLKTATVKDLEAWDAFQSNEKELADKLMKDVSAAVNLKTTRNEYR